MPDRQFARYKQASLAHQACAANRLLLGTPRDPTVEHLGAIRHADAALELAIAELSAARQDYLHDPGVIQ